MNINIESIFPFEKVGKAVAFYKSQGFRDVYVNELYMYCTNTYIPNKYQAGGESVDSQWGKQVSKNSKQLGLEFIEMNVFSSRLKSETQENVRSSRWKIL